jgi:outer membrane protein assembly factor BamB
MTFGRARGFRRARGCLLVCAVLTLAACGTASPQNTQHTQNAKAAPAKTKITAAPDVGSCGTPPPRYAWADDVTTGGQLRWQTALPTRSIDGGIATTPAPAVLAGPVAVFDQDGVVYGLRLADGRKLWSWPGGQAVYGMWRWGGLVVVLTDQASNHARLTGLDAATGQVRWTLKVPGRGLYANQAATADGGLAMINASSGMLQVVSLADGHLRWQRKTGVTPMLTAAAGNVIFAGNGRLTGYDDLTGQPRWTTAEGMPAEPTDQLTGDLVLVTSDVQGGGAPTAVTAVFPATGRIAWRFDPGEPPTVLSAGPAGLAVATYVFNRRLYLLDPRTGRPRWQADTAVTLNTIPLITKSAVISAEGIQGTALVARAAADGRVLWRDGLAQSPDTNQQVAQAGLLAVLQTNSARPDEPAPLAAYRLTSGALAWRIDMPTFVPVSPVPVTGGFLVQPSDPGSACPVAAELRTDAGKTPADRA